jgi:hypothetical protein
MKDIETKLGLDKAILAAQFSLESMIQRFNEAETQLPSGVVSQIIKLQESLEDMFQFRYPNCDHDVRVGLTTYGVQEVLDEAQTKEWTAIRAAEEPVSTKFKVQVPCVNGWADIKAFTDEGSYEAALFDSHAAALADLVAELDPSTFRIVPEGTAAADLY